MSRLTTPARDEASQPNQTQHTRHDMAVGPSPPRETPRKTQNNVITKTSTATITSSPYRKSSEVEELKLHSVSVGSSPPRDQTQVSYGQSALGNQKKSTGTSPPRETRIDTPLNLRSSTSSRTNVSNTGTSPPPQSISTQVNEEYIFFKINLYSSLHNPCTQLLFIILLCTILFTE